jgi:hypothetical protein
MAEKRIALQRAIQTWTVAQGVYMPYVTTARAIGSFDLPPSEAQNLSPVSGNRMLDTSTSVSNGTTAAASGQGSLAHTTEVATPHVTAAYSLSPLPNPSSTPSGRPVEVPSTSIPVAEGLTGGSAKSAAAPADDGTGRKRKRRGGRRKGGTQKRKTGAGPKTTRKSTDDVGDYEHAEHIALWMPSQVPIAKRTSVCSADLFELEERFRLAEAEDALVAVKKALRMHALVRAQFKGAYGTAGNKRVTRGHDSITSFWKKVERSWRQYNTSRDALLALNPAGAWRSRFLELSRADLRGPYALDDNEDLQATGTERYRERNGGHTVPSWIWAANVRASDPDADEPEEQVATQWSKLMAYAERWDEELVLIPEEMRRVLAYLEWKAAWWLVQSDRRQDTTALPTLADGLHAYAHRQASLCIAWRNQYACHWLPILDRAELGQGWAWQYRHLLRRTAMQRRAAPSQTQPVFDIDGDVGLIHPC